MPSNAHSDRQRNPRAALARAVLGSGPVVTIAVVDSLWIDRPLPSQASSLEPPAAVCRRADGAVPVEASAADLRILAAVEKSTGTQILMQPKPRAQAVRLSDECAVSAVPPDCPASIVRITIEQFRTTGSPKRLFQALDKVCQGRSADLAMRTPRIACPGGATMAGVALTRHRERALNEVAFGRERALLCSAGRVEDSDLAWIGLFHRVPLAATERLEIDERRGVLSLFLKPDAAAILSRQRKPSVSIAIGRNRRTGALIHTLVPDLPCAPAAHALQ